MNHTQKLWIVGVVILLVAGGAAGWRVLQEATGVQDTRPIEDPLEAIAHSDDVPWLEKVAGSLDEARKLDPPESLAGSVKDVRTQAYARLGELATPECLGAVERIEKAAKAQALLPERMSFAESMHPCWHFADSETEIWAQTKTADGKTYGIIVDYLLGDTDFFLVSNETPDDAKSWTRPRLLPIEYYWQIDEPKLTASGVGTLKFSFVQHEPGVRNVMDGGPDPVAAPSTGSKEYEISIAEVLKDTDGDGWTDIEEARLGLSKDNPDTDGDGVLDGKDICPNYAPTKDEAQDEEAIIIQKAVFATFGLSGSRYLLLVTEARKVQAWGYGGPILYIEDMDVWRKDRPDDGIFVSWEVSKEGNSATVGIIDYEGPLAAGDQWVTLKKIGGKWIVVGRERGWVS